MATFKRRAPPFLGITSNLPWLLLAPALFTCLLGCGSDGSDREEFPLLRISELSGYADVLAQLKDQSQKSRPSNLEILSEEVVVEERIGLDLRGFSYHPNLVDFSLGVVLGSLQHEYAEDRNASSIQGDDIGIIAEFELSADILRHKPYPGRLYVKHDQTTQSRAFRSSLQTNRDIQSISWRLEDSTHPLHARFEHRRFDYEPLDDSDPGGFTETTSATVGGSYRFDNDHQIRLEYEHLVLEEQPSGLDYASNEIILIHSLKWNTSNRLESRVEYLDQFGNYDIQRVRARSDLRIAIVDDLTGRLTAEYRDQERSLLVGTTTVSDQTFDVSAGLMHKLFESLVTNLDGYYRTQQLNDDSGADEYGGRFDINYRKKNALGRLRINYTFAYDVDSRRSASGLPIDVFDEAHTFPPDERFLLDNRRVVLSSIVITDSTNATIYVEGLDYTVRTLGDEVEIERLLGGTILPGQTVLVDYRYDLGGRFTLRSVAHNVGISQEFDFGLTLGYLYRTQDQQLTEGTVLDAAFESYDAHTFRASFRWGNLRARARYELYDSNITENESIRAGLSYTHTFDWGGRLSVNGDWNQRKEKRPTVRDTTYVSFGGDYRQRLFGNLDFNVGARWRIGFDDVTGDTDGLDLDVGVAWSQGNTEFRGSFLLNELSGEFSDNSSSTILLQLRRTF